MKYVGVLLSVVCSLFCASAQTGAAMETKHREYSNLSPSGIRWNVALQACSARQQRLCQREDLCATQWPELVDRLSQDRSKSSWCFALGNAPNFWLPLPSVPSLPCSSFVPSSIFEAQVVENASLLCCDASGRVYVDLSFRFAVCGDGHVQLEAGEECDDGNVVHGDGCSGGCTLESTSSPAQMTPTVNGGFLSVVSRQTSLHKDGSDRSLLVWLEDDPLHVGEYGITDSGSTVYMACSPSNICLGNNTCAEGHEPSSPRCAACQENYFDLYGRCRTCSEMAYLWFTVGCVTAIFIFLLVVLFRLEDLRYAKMVLMYCVIIGTYADAHLFDIPWDANMQFCLSAMALFLYFLQPVSWVIQCLLSSLPQIMTLYIPVLTLPVAVLAVFALLLKCNSRHKKRSVEDKQVLENKLIQNSLLVLWIWTPCMTVHFTSMLLCVDIPGLGSYWLSRPSAECWSGDHFIWSILGYAVVFPFFSFGVPGLFFWIAEKRLKPQQFKAPQQVELDNGKFGFLIREYKQERYYWEALELVHRQILTSVPFLLPSYTPHQRLTVQVIVNGGWMAIFGALSPMKLSEDMYMQMMLQFASVLTGVIGLAAVIPDSGFSDLATVSPGLMYALAGLFGTVVAWGWFRQSSGANRRAEAAMNFPGKRSRKDQKLFAALSPEMMNVMSMRQGVNGDNAARGGGGGGGGVVGMMSVARASYAFGNKTAKRAPGPQNYAQEEYEYKVDKEDGADPDGVELAEVRSSSSRTSKVTAKPVSVLKKQPSSVSQRSLQYEDSEELQRPVEDTLAIESYRRNLPAQFQRQGQRKKGLKASNIL